MQSAYQQRFISAAENTRHIDDGNWKGVPEYETSSGLKQLITNPQ